MTNNLEFYLTPEAEAENEWVAGVRREKLESNFPQLPFSGVLEIDESQLIAFLQKNLEFRPRNEALERDETFEQLITYFILKNKKGEVFLSQRKAKGGEARAHGAYLIGFGGHLRKEDIKGTMSKWLKREFEEEIKVEKLLSIKFIGLFNDDSDEMQRVNRVHFGIVFEMQIDGDAEVMEKDKFEPGRFVPISELSGYLDKMETWSRVIVNDRYLSN